ncbi:hypothetical protein F4804DRAFT_65487 [Jackrogersella minutella]|nr:hypothetical protein F4804DRAFT_65487 [Jackrogersella minutella]
MFDGNTIHPEFSILIEDTIQITGRAADALESYLTALALTWYTDFLTTLKGTIEVSIACTKTVQIAQQYKVDGCKGLVSVAALLGFYLLCVFLTSSLFIRQISYSKQGNSWHAISQPLGSELEEALEKGNNKDDTTVEKWMKEEGKEALVRLEKSEGKIQVVRSYETPQHRNTKRWVSWLPKFSKKNAVN